MATLPFVWEWIPMLKHFIPFISSIQPKQLSSWFCYTFHFHQPMFVIPFYLSDIDLHARVITAVQNHIGVLALSWDINIYDLLLIVDHACIFLNSVSHNIKKRFKIFFILIPNFRLWFSHLVVSVSLMFRISLP